MYDFFVDYKSFDVSDITSIHKYLMKKTWYKIVFGLIKTMFIRLLNSKASISNQAKCVSLNIQKCMTQTTLINLHLNEYNQELHYYPFAVNLDRCAGSCNTLNEVSNKVSVPSEKEDLNLHVSVKITGINKSRTLTKQLSYKCKWKFDDRKSNFNQN